MKTASLTLITVCMAALLAGCGEGPEPPAERPQTLAATGGATAPAALLAGANGVETGSTDASVVVYELSDFQCPACRLAAQSFLPAFKQSYVETGKVRFVFVDFPLPNHRNAVPAALAARCAEEQDAFWAYHDVLFEKQTEWSLSTDPRRRFIGYADDLDLDTGLFENCVYTERHLETVAGNLEVARALGARGTPTFFVDGQAILGAGREVTDAIEAALAAAGPGGA